MRACRRKIHNWKQQEKPNKKTKISIRKRKCSSNTEEEKGYATSNNEFNKLSADIITSIFLRCSVKTLSISRCVSKLWNDLINCPSFVHSHMEQSIGNSKLISMQYDWLRDRTIRPRFVSVDMEGINEELYTVTYPDSQIPCSLWGVSAGLVCLSTYQRIYLCNPAIHQICELPNCSPTTSPVFNVLGFGYLHSRKEYKVVHFFYTGPLTTTADLRNEPLKCEVFTLKGGVGDSISNGKWKEIAKPPSHPCLRGLLLDGCMYWLASIQLEKLDRIISFDFETEKYLTISCPRPHPSAFEDLSGHTLLDLKGALCLPDLNGFRRSSILDLWILEDKIGCTWVKEYSINLGSYGFKNNLTSSFRMWNEEIVFRYKLDVFFYDLKRKCFREVKTKLRLEGLKMYSKSLFCLGSI